MRPTAQHARRRVSPVLAVLFVLSLVRSAGGQQPPATAELKRVVGRVEILRKRQTESIPAVIGAHLVEGDDVRVLAGASAELALTDTSTVALVENSRLLLAKLELDRQQGSRLVLVHLAVGKLRVVIAQASAARVRLRQSNFAISTPTAVAVARGTVVWVFTDGRSSVVGVEPERLPGVASRVDCIPLAGVPAGGALAGQMVLAGGVATDCGAPTPIERQMLTLTNAATANAVPLAGAPVVVPPRAFEAAVLGVWAPTPEVLLDRTGTQSR